MYGKIFDSIYEGTLYGQWEAIVTFQQMIVLCDADGVIDMTPPAIAARTSIPLEIIQKGIEILEKPDPYSRTPDEEGCRIALIDDHKPWGWYIVNHKKYKQLQDSDTVRAQTRERVRKHREKKRLVTDGNGPKRHTDTDTDTDTDTIKRLLSEAFRLSDLLAELILKNKPDYRELRKDKKEKTLLRWGTDIDKMIRLDSRSSEQIEKVIRWCQQDSFWHKNILSGEKLRKQFDKLELAMKEQNNGSGRLQGTSGGRETREQRKQRYAAEARATLGIRGRSSGIPSDVHKGRTSPEGSDGMDSTVIEGSAVEVTET